MSAPGMANWREIIPHRPGPPRFSIRSSIASTCCGSSARTGCRASSCAASPTAPSTPSLSPRRRMRSASRPATSSTRRRLRFVYSSMTTPAETYDYDMETRERTLRKRQEVPSGHNAGRLRHAPSLCAGARRRDGAGLDPLPQGHAARRLGAAAALRLRRLRHLDPGLVLDDAAVARRPRLHLRHRAHPRRQGQGLSLVHGRQARAKGQHVHRLHRRRRIPRRRRADASAGASSPTAARPAAC